MHYTSFPATTLVDHRPRNPRKFSVLVAHRVQGGLPRSTSLIGGRYIVDRAKRRYGPIE